MENTGTTEAAAGSNAQAVETPSAKGAVTPSAYSASSVPQGTKAPADGSPSSTPEFDARTSHESLMAELAKQNKSYAELRREFTRRTQNEAALQAKIDNLTSIISKAAEVPIDPEQFFKDLQTQGPKAFEPLLQRERESLQSAHQTAMQSLEDRVTMSEYRAEKFARLMDTETYPDYKKLEPTMKQLAEDENTPIDFDRSPGEVLDALYKLARTLSMEDAVKAARDQAKQEAEASLAKESATSVAAGGKAGVPTDAKNLSGAELRKWAVQQFGEAE